MRGLLHRVGCWIDTACTGVHNPASNGPLPRPTSLIHSNRQLFMRAALTRYARVTFCLNDDRAISIFPGSNRKTNQSRPARELQSNYLRGSFLRYKNAKCQSSRYQRNVKQFSYRKSNVTLRYIARIFFHKRVRERERNNDAERCDARQ